MGYIKKGKSYPSLKEQEKILDDFFNQEIYPEIDYFIDYSLAIAVNVDEILNEQGLTQKDLAKKLDKRESEISKWLSGAHNLTLRSIAKLSAALGKKLIFTDKEVKQKYEKPAKHFRLYALASNQVPKRTYQDNKQFSSNLHIVKKTG